MTGTIYFYPDNVDAAWKQVKDVCEVVQPIADREYGMREFVIKDNNGYRLSFGQPTGIIADFDRYFPASFTLETPKVLLRALQPEDIEPLRLLAKEKEIWTYFV